MKDRHLTPEFTTELFKSCFDSGNIFDVVRQHLKYSYLINEVEKKFWKECLTQYTLKEKRPTLGLIQVAMRKEKEVVDYIAKIKETIVNDHADVVEAFKQFIKEGKFVELFNEVADMYNKGEEMNATKILIKGAEELAGFGIKDKYYKKVFEDFAIRNANRKDGTDARRKVPFMMDELDDVTKGGPETGEIILFLGESGMGKSMELVHHGVSTARRGGRVAHFQLEGTEQQCLNRYDANWTGALYHDIKKGELSDKSYDKCKKIVDKIGRGEVYVEAFEKFGSATINDIRNSIRELKKLYGQFDLVLIDYLELIELGDGVKYGANDERFRQERIGRMLKEIAMEEDVVIGTATQASNLNYELKKDQDFVMTREYLADAKGKIRPFDYFITMNQTPDERNNNLMRLHCDKLREHKAGQTMTIATNFSRSRFYDRKRTLDLMLDEEIDD